METDAQAPVCPYRTRSRSAAKRSGTKLLPFFGRAIVKCRRLRWSFQGILVPELVFAIGCFLWKVRLWGERRIFVEMCFSFFVGIHSFGG